MVEVNIVVVILKYARSCYAQTRTKGSDIRTCRHAISGCSHLVLSDVLFLEFYWRRCPGRHVHSCWGESDQ